MCHCVPQYFSQRTHYFDDAKKFTKKACFNLEFASSFLKEASIFLFTVAGIAVVVGGSLLLAKVIPIKAGSALDYLVTHFGYKAVGVIVIVTGSIFAAILVPANGYMFYKGYQRSKAICDAEGFFKPENVLV